MAVRHRLTRVLPYTPEQLFELVGEVSLYPEFVPWVTSMRVRNLRNEAEGVTTLDAEAAVGFSFLKERFTTRVRRDPNRLEIDVALISGPFRRLTNHWKFEGVPSGAKVLFEIDFEFRSRLLDALLAANFHRAVDRLIGCFEARAEQLYAREEVVAALASAHSS